MQIDTTGKSKTPSSETFSAKEKNIKKLNYYIQFSTFTLIYQIL